VKLFIGGATGATGQDLVRIARDRDIEMVVQVRPQSEQKYRLQQPSGPEPLLVGLDEHDKLVEAMTGCTAVISMIGTMKKRFASGDTYASSDIGSTRQLVDAAKAAGVPRFVLMGAQGTGWIPGAYYAAKREAEGLVFRSGLSWTVHRPGALVGNGRGHPAMSAFGVTTEACARALLRSATEDGYDRAILGNGDIKSLGR
jgi:uncharacterized protein YbjT (DUF2867 family)